MVETATVGYALGSLGMFAGIVMWWVLWSADDVDSDRGAFRWLAIIPVAAFVAYVLMTLELGTITVDGVTVPVPRYVDWLVTTPVLVGYVAYVAGVPRRYVIGTVAVDVAMIVIGWGGVVTTGTTRAVAFGLSSLCYVGLLVALYGVFPDYAAEQSGVRQRLFEVLQNHVGLLWVAYPVVWAAGPLGVGAITTLGVTLLVTFMDVMAKTPYVYFVYVHRSAFGERTTDAAGESGVGGPADSPGTTAGDGARAGRTSGGGAR